MTLSNWQEQLRRGGLDLAILLTVSSGPLTHRGAKKFLGRWRERRSGNRTMLRA